MHLRIGRLLLSQLPEEAIAERIFDVVNQLNRGVALITDPHEGDAVPARLPGREKRRRPRSRTLPPAATWPRRPRCCLRTPGAPATRRRSRFPWSCRNASTSSVTSSGPTRCSTCSSSGPAPTPTRPGSIAYACGSIKLTGRFDDAVAVALIGLRLFGVSFPATEAESQAAFEAEHRVLAEALRGRRVADLADAPIAVDVDARVIPRSAERGPVALLSRATAAVSPAGDQALRYSLQYGNTEESCFAYSALRRGAGVESGRHRRRLRVLAPGAALEREVQRSEDEGKLLLVHGGNVNFWRRSFATSLPFLGRGSSPPSRIGDLLFAFCNAYLAIWLRVEKGDPLDEVIEGIRRYAALSERSHFDGRGPLLPPSGAVRGRPPRGGGEGQARPAPGSHRGAMPGLSSACRLRLGNRPSSHHAAGPGLLRGAPCRCASGRRPGRGDPRPGAGQPGRGDPTSTTRWP